MIFYEIKRIFGNVFRRKASEAAERKLEKETEKAMNNLSPEEKAQLQKMHEQEMQEENRQRRSS